MRGDRVKTIRELREMSQQDLADRVGIHAQQIYKIEKESSVPRADTLIRLAKELGVSADYILGLTDDPEGGFAEEALNPMERKLLAAWRREDTREILVMLSKIGEHEKQ